MNEAKFYKLDQTYYKRDGNTTERVSAYRHYHSVSITHTSQFETDEMVEITEVQFIRIKKLILAKLLK
jgi:hypothetical protein